MKTILKAAALAAFAAAPALAEDGVTDDEVKVGGAHDLSGIFAPFSVPAVKGAQHYFDQVNAAGGVHGRKITYIVEDHGYQVPKAMQAANKLINRDKVFAMLLNLGTPHNLAMFRMMKPKGVPNVSPLSAARSMAEPLEDWKWAGTADYYTTMRKTTAFLIDEEKKEAFCAMLLPTDFGEEIEAALQDELKARGQKVIATTHHKPDEKDFAGALGKLRQAGCKTVEVALGVSQMITAVVTAQKMGFEDMTFVSSSAGFLPVTAGALGKNGVTLPVYAGAGYKDVSRRLEEPAVKAWAESYTAATGEPPTTAAMLGHAGAVLMHKALEATGPDLTRAKFNAAMEKLAYEDPVAGYFVDYGPEEHVGADVIFVSKAEGGVWNLVGQVDDK